jgi:hypothetical protein
MHLYSSVMRRPALVVGGVCALVGFLGQGLEAALLWALVGYFVAESLQSVIWTWTGGPST